LVIANLGFNPVVTVVFGLVVAAAKVWPAGAPYRFLEVAAAAAAAMGLPLVILQPDRQAVSEVCLAAPIQI
jgi:hypothetical protein